MGLGALHIYTCLGSHLNQLHLLIGQYEVFSHCIEDYLFIYLLLLLLFMFWIQICKLLEPTSEDILVVKVERKKCEEDELFCRGHILKTLFEWLIKGSVIR